MYPRCNNLPAKMHPAANTSCCCNAVYVSALESKSEEKVCALTRHTFVSLGYLVEDQV